MEKKESSTVLNTNCGESLYFFDTENGKTNVPGRGNCRSGLLNHSEPDGCAPFNTSDDDAFQKFKELVLSSKFQDFIGITHEKLGNYSLLPHR